MATRKVLKHASDTISAGKLVTLNVPVFDTITQIGLTFTNSGAAATLANIISGVSTITILVNGEQILNASADSLSKAWASLGPQVGLSALVNSFPLLIAPLIYKLPAAEDTFAIGCERWAQGNKVDNIQVQVQFAGSVTGLTDVQCYTERVNKGTGQNVTVAICKLLSYPQSTSSTGIDEVSNLPKDSNMGRLFTLAIPSTAVISGGECLVNNNPVIQDCDLATDDMIVAERGFSPVSGVFNYSFSDGGTMDLLSMQGVDDMRFRTNLSTAGNYVLLDATVRTVA